MPLTAIGHRAAVLCLLKLAGGSTAEQAPHCAWLDKLLNAAKECQKPVIGLPRTESMLRDIRPNIPICEQAKAESAKLHQSPADDGQPGSNASRPRLVGKLLILFKLGV
jgi:hypothetical protein